MANSTADDIEPHHGKFQLEQVGAQDEAATSHGVATQPANPMGYLGPSCATREAVMESLAAAWE